MTVQNFLLDYYMQALKPKEKRHHGIKGQHWGIRRSRKELGYDDLTQKQKPSATADSNAPAKKASANQSARAREILDRLDQYSNKDLVEMRVRNEEIKKLRDAYESTTMKGKLKKFLSSDYGKATQSMAMSMAIRMAKDKTQNPSANQVLDVLEKILESGNSKYKTIPAPKEKSAMEAALEAMRKQKKSIQDEIELERFEADARQLNAELEKLRKANATAAKKK